MINVNKHRHHTDLIIELNMKKIFTNNFYSLYQFVNNVLTQQKTLFFCLFLALGFGFGIAFFNEPSNFQTAQKIENSILAKLNFNGTELNDAHYLSDSSTFQF